MRRKRSAACEIASSYLPLFEMEPEQDIKLSCLSSCANALPATLHARVRCPRPQEECQPAELLAGQFCSELIAQGSVFHCLDHSGSQQQRLYLVGKASRLSHEPLVGGLAG